MIVRLDGQGQRLVRIADWQTAARAATTSGTALPGSVMEGTEHVQALLDPSTYIYQAPEASARVDVDETRLGVFSLGALAYLVLTGQPPAEDLPGLRRRLAAEGGLDLAGHLDGVPEGLRALVLDATRGEVAMRLPDVEAFLDRLAQVERELAEPEPPEDLDPLEAPPGTLLMPTSRPTAVCSGGPEQDDTCCGGHVEHQRARPQRHTRDQTPSGLLEGTPPGQRAVCKATPPSSSPPPRPAVCPVLTVMRI